MALICRWRSGGNPEYLREKYGVDGPVVLHLGMKAFEKGSHNAGRGDEDSLEQGIERVAGDGRSQPLGFRRLGCDRSPRTVLDL